jgi:S1-C subfamily serine protease
MKALLAAVLSLVLVGCAPVEAPKAHTLVSFEQVRAATWRLESEDGACSAVLIAPEKLLTAAHCQGPDMKVEGREAIVIKVNKEADLMLLLVPGLSCPCVPVAEVNGVIDEKVYTVGYPLGYAQVLTEGRVQGEFVQDVDELAHLFMLTSPVVFGNSGGPVLVIRDGEWQVVGIVSRVVVLPMGFGYSVIAHLGFAVRTDVINKFLEGLGVSPVQR